MLTILIAGLALTASQDGADPIAASDLASLRTCLSENDHDPYNCDGLISEACMSEDGGHTTAEMAGCMGRELAAWDVLLNERYATLMTREQDVDTAGYAEGRADQLRDAQRAWLAHRDADCLYEGDLYQGGSSAGVVRAGCMIEKTADRAIWLDDMAREP